jgi:hypothetical protein
MSLSPLKISDYGSMTRLCCYRLRDEPWAFLAGTERAGSCADAIHLGLLRITRLRKTPPA